MPAAPTLQFSILGPLEARANGVPLALGGSKQRALLALLLLHANEAVSRDRLIDALWAEHPPASAGHALDVFVSRLRKVLGKEAIETVPPGYRIAVSGEQLDSSRFLELLERAKQGEPEHAAADLREALSLFRGEPLSDFAYESFAQEPIARFQELRLRAVEERIEADLGRGRHGELVPELRALVAEHPLRERLQSQLMRALYRSGRQAEALDAYQAARRALVDELGIEPGADLRELEAAILRQDASLAAPSTAGLPQGTVTLLFTDIEGATRLLGLLGTEAYQQLLDQHDALLRNALAAHGGRIVDTAGDGALVAFAQAGAAVSAALEAQRAIAGCEWPERAELRLRMGIHTGEPVLAGDRYIGLDVHRAARICQAGHGRQVLISQATAALLADDISLRDLGEHRLRDVAQPVRLFQLVDAELPNVLPPLRTVDNRPTNLPAQPTPLVGRERELADLRTLLARDDVRVATLTGPGGSGKTRLALQLGGELLDRFASGVFFVALAPVGAPGFVVPAIAQTLGVREMPGQSASETLADYLRNKDLLLVLDNLEQLLPDAARPLAHLLTEAPKLKLVVTTRATMRISGEHEYPVSPLQPDDALTLFADRARAVDADFQATRDDQAIVEEICARLDFLPLAIELAAARVKALTPAAILERLERRLPLLTGGAHDLPDRHRTLEAAIKWSYDLLAPEEQVLFSRLSVFVGGWTLESAEQVCDADIDTLHSLIDKSLVRHESGRYRMLETVREYADERLAEADQREATAARHAAYFAEFSRQSGRELRRAIPGAIHAFRAELHNLRAAVAWALGHEPPHAAAIVASAWPFWCDQGLLAEGDALARQVLSHVESLAPFDRAECLRGASQLLRSAGDLELAKGLTRDEIEIVEALGGHDDRVARAKADLAWFAVEEGDYAAARALADEALAVRRRAGDRRRFGDAERSEIEAAILFSEGRFAEARTLFREIEPVQEAVGGAGDAMRTRMMVGQCCRRLGELEEAGDLLGEALAFFSDVGAASVIPECLQEVGAVALESGELPTAVRVLGASARLRRELGTPLWDPPDWERTVAAARERLGEAAYDEAWRSGQALDQAEAVALALTVAPARAAPAAATVEPIS